MGGAGAGKQRAAEGCGGRKRASGAGQPESQEAQPRNPPSSYLTFRTQHHQGSPAICICRFVTLITEGGYQLVLTLQQREMGALLAPEHLMFIATQPRVGPTIIPTFQKRKLRYKGGKRLGPTAPGYKWRSCSVTQQWPWGRGGPGLTGASGTQGSFGSDFLLWSAVAMVDGAEDKPGSE